MFWSAYFTLVADIAEPSERDRWYGLAGAAQNIGLALGGPLAGLLVADAGLPGYRIVVIVNCVSFLLAAVLLLFGVHTKRPQQHEVAESGGYRTLMRDRPFLILTLTGVLYALGSMFFSLGIPIYITTTLQQPAWAIGFVLGFNTILLAALQTIVVRHLEPYRRTRALMLVGLLLGIWCGTTALAIWIPSWLLLPYLFGITCVYTLAELISAPTSSALVAAASPDALRGRYLAFFQFSWGIASIAAPGLFTALFSFAPTLPWLVVGVLMLLASFSIYRLEAHLPKRAIYKREK
jgi:MFS family permease